jgi:hypothetical protein
VTRGDPGGGQRGPRAHQRQTSDTRPPLTNQLLGWEAPRGAVLDMIYSNQLNNKSRLEMTESALAAIEVALIYKNEGLP